MSFVNTFQTFTDLATSNTKITLVTVYAGGSNVYFRSIPFFNAFKYFKLGPVEIKLVPASTLPVDPTNLSYEKGESTVDPRDMLTPGLVRITNGENFWTDLDEIDEEDAMHAFYNSMCLDPRWFKWNLQSGITKRATPRYWDIGQLQQDYYPGQVQNLPMATKNSTQKLTLISTVGVASYYDTEAGQSPYKTDQITNFSSARSLMQPGTMSELGWLPTDSLIKMGVSSNNMIDVYPAIGNIPHVELFRIIMPPAYKTKFFYRMFITETVYFKEKVVQPPLWYDDSPVGKVFAPLDRFIRSEGTKTAVPVVSTNVYAPSYPVTANDFQENIRPLGPYSKEKKDVSNNTAGEK